MALSKEGEFHDPLGPWDPFKTYVKTGKMHGYKTEFTIAPLKLFHPRKSSDISKSEHRVIRNYLLDKLQTSGSINMANCSSLPDDPVIQSNKEKGLPVSVCALQQL